MTGSNRLHLSGMINEFRKKQSEKPIRFSTRIFQLGFQLTGPGGPKAACGGLLASATGAAAIPHIPGASLQVAMS